MKHVGIRCDTVATDDVYYLLFYDIDKPELTLEQIKGIDEMMRQYNISYILYKTKNGYHLVGLSPLNILQHGMAFHTLKKMFEQYYGGIVIRVTQKQDEQQKLVVCEQGYGEVIPNLFNVFADRFGLEKKPWVRQTSKYLLVFVRYRSDK